VGLAIVRKVAERHRGRAWAESEVGRGSTFFLAISDAPAGD
jgi:signal transduction histidine kinase